ncbi:MAG: SMC-Scp complex subunit ScpB [Nitrospirota bacterium]
MKTTSTVRAEGEAAKAPSPLALFEGGPETQEPTASTAVSSGEGEPEARPAVEEREMCAILEALLFVSQGPLTVERMASVLEGVPKAELRQALKRMQEEYEAAGRSLQLVEIAGGFQLVTRPDYAPWIKRLEKAKAAPKLSRSAMESLAIIAYKQPIVRSEIEHIRGVETSGVIRTLLERKLVRIVGRKDVPGRPIMYGTTKYFLQHFGLRDLSELPPLREFKELGEAEQAELPVGEDPLTIGADRDAAEPEPESVHHA